MGDVGSAIQTPFVAVASTIDGTANDKIYYDCPRCGEEVYVYGAGGAFKGRPCLHCRSNDDWVKSAGVAFNNSESSSTKASYYNNYNIVEESIDSSDYKEKIINIRVRSIWIVHGSLAAIGSTFTGITTGNSITHWWVEIETESTSRWYCAQWIKPNLVLSYHGSRDQVTKKGKSAVGAEENESKNITNKYDYDSRDRGRTIGDLKDWMESYHNKKGGFDVVNNNCQHFGKALYDWI